MCQVNEADGDGSLSSLLVCDRCEKVRSVKGDVPDGRWTCCHQPEEVSANNGAAGKREREKERDDEEVEEVCLREGGRMGEGPLREQRIRPELAPCSVDMF